MITIPQHIRRKIQNIEFGLQEQLKGNCHEGLTEHCLRLIQDVQTQLKKQKGTLFKSSNDYINIFNIMKAIEESCYELYYPHLSTVLIDVELEEELSFALNHARAVHPRMRQEIDRIIKFLEDVPLSSWGQVDSFDKFKVFKLVKTKKQWEKIIQKNDGSNLSINNTIPDFQYVKIWYTHTETNSYNPSGTAKKAKDYIIKKYGKDFFESKRKFFEEWFRIGRTGTYYIYVPK